MLMGSYNPDDGASHESILQIPLNDEKRACGRNVFSTIMSDVRKRN